MISLRIVIGPSFVETTLLTCLQLKIESEIMLLRLLLIFLSLHQVAFSENLNDETHGSHQILVIGDSLSAEYGIETGKGWVNLLNNRLREQNTSSKWTIVNASISGDTTAGGMERLPKLIQNYQPVLCILALGANDGLRGLLIDDMQNNLDNMVKQCQASGTSLLVGMHLPPNYGKTYTNAFHQVYADVANNNGITYVPFMLEGIALEDRFFQSDRLHPTTEAQPIILENIWSKLENMLKTITHNI